MFLVISLERWRNMTLVIIMDYFVSSEVISRRYKTLHLTYVIWYTPWCHLTGLPYTRPDNADMVAQRLSGRVLDSRPSGRGFEPYRRHCVVSLSKNIKSSLVLVQPRKIRPFITERLLMRRKESIKLTSDCSTTLKSRSIEPRANILLVKHISSLAPSINANIRQLLFCLFHLIFTFHQQSFS